LWVGGGVTALVFGLLIASEVVDSITGCGSVDPTDPANYTNASIVNDTSRVVTIADCRGDYCQPDTSVVRLAPGERVAVTGACAATGKDMTSWKATREDGTVVGYIAIDTPRSRQGVVYDLSMPSPDRLTATTPAQVGAATR